MRVQGVPVLAHRLSMRIETGEWPDGVVMHRCDNPPCVRPSHLKEGTPALNVADAFNKGRSRIGSGGEKHFNAKLSAAQVEDIRQALTDGARGDELAARYGVSQATISHIRRGKKWSGPDLGRAARVWSRALVLTPDQVQEIRSSPLSRRELAQRHNVSQTTISRVRRGIGSYK